MCDGFWFIDSTSCQHQHLASPRPLSGKWKGVTRQARIAFPNIYKIQNYRTEFGKVYINGSAIAWSEDLEIDVDTIYAEITNTKPVKFSHKPVYHAAD